MREEDIDRLTTELVSAVSQNCDTANLDVPEAKRDVLAVLRVELPAIFAEE